MPRKSNGTTSKRPQCQVKGCRRVAREEGMCLRHFELVQPVEGNNGERTAALSDAEAEQWGRLFAEFKSHDQAAQLLVHRMQLEKQRFDQAIAELERKRHVELARAKEVRGHYEQVTGELCTKYRMERQFTIIDVEGRVIREERPAAT